VWRIDPLIKSPRPEVNQLEKNDLETGYNTSADGSNNNLEIKSKYILDEEHRESGGRKGSNLSQFSVAL
jgi:hypothetical protein